MAGSRQREMMGLCSDPDSDHFCRSSRFEWGWPSRIFGQDGDLADPRHDIPGLLRTLSLLAERCRCRRLYLQERASGSSQRISERADEHVEVTLQHIDMRRNPQTFDMLDLAIFRVDLVFLSKSVLQFFHVGVVD